MTSALILTVSLTLLLGLGDGLPHKAPRAENSKWKTLDGKPTVLFAHRGEKVLLPEHTIPAYKTASILGADFVEPDLCLTKDDHFVCHHDLFLKDGTDVADRDEFAHLRNITVNDWYINDFTLEELKTLRIRQQKVGVRPSDFDGVFAIPTFEEYLATVHEMIYKLNKTIGVVPELKDPKFHNDRRQANFMENKLLAALQLAGYGSLANPATNCIATIDGKPEKITCPTVVIQSFELPALQFLKPRTKFSLLQLIDTEYGLLTYKGMEEVAKVATYYSLWKEYLYVGVEADLKYNNVSWDRTEVARLGGFVPPQEFPTVAHDLGMKIVLYTINDSHEKSTMGCANVTNCEPKNKVKELDYFFDLGVDGVFVENVAESREIRRDYQELLDRSNGNQKSFTIYTSGILVAFWICIKML